MLLYVWLRAWLFSSFLKKLQSETDRKLSPALLACCPSCAQREQSANSTHLKSGVLIAVGIVILLAEENMKDQMERETVCSCAAGRHAFVSIRDGHIHGTT